VAWQAQTTAEFPARFDASPPGPRSKKELMLPHITSLSIKNHLDIMSANREKATLKTKLRTD
jgi:hypothetical protein